jgi:uncharacterized coiled-coil protein SlyX
MADVEKLVSSLQAETKDVKKSIESWRDTLAVHRRIDGKFEDFGVEDNKEEHVILDALEKHLTSLHTTVEGLATTVANHKKLQIKLSERIAALEKRCKKVAKVVETKGGGV